MRCGQPANVTQILIGLHRVGITRLREALESAAASGLTDRGALVDHIVTLLEEDNFVPEKQRDAFRLALWREYSRFRGQDIRPYFSGVEVEVRGREGERRDRFVELLTSVFGDFELRPSIRYLPPEAEVHEAKEEAPELLIHGETVVRGEIPRQHFKAAVGQRISDGGPG